MASFWDKSQSAARLTCKDEVFFLAAARWDTLSSLDVCSSEMSHFEKQQKSTSFSAPPRCLPLGLCFPSSPSLCVSACPSPSLFPRDVRGRECSGERERVGWNAGLAPPAVWKAGAGSVQRHTPGERKGEQMERTPGQERQTQPCERALAHTDSSTKGYCGRL